MKVHPCHIQKYVVTSLDLATKQLTSTGFFNRHALSLGIIVTLWYNRLYIFCPFQNNLWLFASDGLIFPIWPLSIVRAMELQRSKDKEMKWGPIVVMKMVTLLFAGIQHWWEEWVLPKRPLLPLPKKRRPSNIAMNIITVIEIKILLERKGGIG